MVLRKSLVLAVFAAAVVAFTASSALAQPRGPGGRRPGGFRGPGGAGGKLMMLQSEEVRKELEIVEDQQKELDKLRDEMRDQMREMFSGMRDVPRDQRRERFEQMREKMRTAAQEMEKKVNAVLLPNQIERLNQLELQMQMRFRGTEGALASDAVVKALGITEEQKKRMQEVAAEAQREMQEAMQKAREEARQKILAVLTPQQQETLKKMVGEQFEMPRPNFRRGQGDRPGRDRAARDRSER